MPNNLTPVTWPVGAIAQLCSVPWDANYRDIVVFDSLKEKTDWFTKLEKASWKSDKFSYLKPNEPVRIPLPYSSAYKYNYLIVTNPVVPATEEGPKRTLYYFVTDTRYINPQTTELTLMLDLVMTYQESIKLGNMFVEGGHIGVSNSNVPTSLADLTGETLYKYMTVSEGIDVGSQYSIVQRDWVPLNDKEGSATKGQLGRIIIVSTVDLAADPGTIENPSLNVADGQTADGIPSGCNVYSIPSTSFQNFMKQMKDKSWAAQGIISISTFPGALLSKGPDVKLFGNKEVMMTFLGETDTLTADDYDAKTIYESTNIFQNLAGGFVDVAAHNLFKLYTYPYSVIELTAWQGNSIFLKPELVRGNKLAIKAICCALAPFARVGLFPDNYNLPSNVNTPFPNTNWHWVGFGKQGDEYIHAGIIPTGDFLDTALWLGDFPQFSMVNNNYITYMASTVNTRNYQYQAAGWGLEKANQGTNVDFENNMRAIANERTGYDASLEGKLQNALFGALGTGGNNATAQTGINLAKDLSGRTAFMSGQTTNIMTANANKNYAKFAAKGDFENTVRGIEAAYQDAQLTPPSVLGQQGGAGFNWKNGLVGFAINYKVISGAALSSCADFFMRYGYRVRRWHNFKQKSITALNVMSHFSYWKLSESNIKSIDCNESEKLAIRGILEKGVTVWTNPDYIGTTNLLDNVPRRNIKY